MKFGDLAMIYTSPFFWKVQDNYADRLRNFLLAILSSEGPGRVRVAVPKNNPPLGPAHLPRNGHLLTLPGQPGEQESTGGDRLHRYWWKEGHDATAYLDAFHDLVRNLEKGDFEAMYDQIWSHSFHAFIDSVRFRHLLESRLGQIDEDAGLKAELEGSNVTARIRGALQSIDWERPFFVDFRVKWSFPGTLLGTPQLRISNFWPADMSPTPDDLEDTHSIEPDEAVDILKGYWLDVETGFRNFRYSFLIGEIDIRLEQRSPVPPVFYYAEPVYDEESERPPTPESLLGRAHLGSLEKLARRLLRTHDLLSSDVTGAFLEGNLLTFRQLLQIQDEFQPHYLIIPWTPSGEDWSNRSESDWSEEVDWETAFVSDHLAYFETAGHLEALSVTNALAEADQTIERSRSILDRAAEHVVGLQDALSFEPHAERKRAYQRVSNLQALISKQEVKTARSTDHVVRQNMEWPAQSEDTLDKRRQAFTLRQVERLNRLDLNDIGSYPLIRSRVAVAIQKAKQFSEHFQAIATALQNMLDREEREERASDDRNQKLLSYGLALLAVVTAFPIVIGQLSWENLRKDEMPSWGRLRWFGHILEFSHSPLVIVASLLALIGIVGLVILISMSRLRRRASAGGPPILGRLSKAWWHAKQAQKSIDLLVSIPHSAGWESFPEIFAARDAIREQDLQACLILSKDWRRSRHAPRAVHSSDENELERIIRDIDEFLIEVEGLDTCPKPFPLPITACLLRHWGRESPLLNLVPEEVIQQTFVLLGCDPARIPEMIRIAGNRRRPWTESFVRGLYDALRPAPVD